MSEMRSQRCRFGAARGDLVLRAKLVSDRFANWLSANVRSFSYLLPDALELALYLGLAAYFVLQIVQQQAYQ